MNIIVTFSSIGTDAGPFNLYSNVDGYTSAFEVGVTRTQLLAGFSSSNAPNGTTIVKAKSFGVCTNEVLINVTGVSTTTTTTSGPMVWPVMGTCCGLGVTEYITYNNAYVIGDVLISVDNGFFVGYEIIGPPVPGVATLTLYDGIVYPDCAYFLAVYAMDACAPFP